MDSSATDLHSFAWNGVERHDLVIVTDGRRPYQPTQVAVARSTDHLLIRFSCMGSVITATMARHQEKVWQEDAVEAFLWPPGDDCVYEFQLSPHSVHRMVRVWAHGTPDQSFDDSWSADLLEARTSVSYRDGAVVDWQALLAIPADLLTGLDACSTPARLGLFRINRRPVEEFSALVAGDREKPNFHDNRLLLPLLDDLEDHRRAD